MNVTNAASFIIFTVAAAIATVLHVKMAKLGFEVVEKSESIAPGRYVYCPDCGSKMHYRYLVLPYMLIDYKDGG